MNIPKINIHRPDVQAVKAGLHNAALKGKNLAKDGLAKAKTLPADCVQLAKKSPAKAGAIVGGGALAIIALTALAKGVKQAVANKH